MGFNGIKKVIFEQHCKHYKGNDGLVKNWPELYCHFFYPFNKNMERNREGPKHFMTFCD